MPEQSRPRTDRPRTERSRAERPAGSEQPRGEKPRGRGGKPRGGAPRAGGGGEQQPRRPRRGGGSPVPAVAEDFTPVQGTPSRPPAASFAELELPAGLMRELGAQGVTEPFPIQAATLPDALAGRDVLGRGRTGSGKTLAFGLPLLVRTAGKRATARRPLALVLVPTRELAQQVTEALAPYAGVLNLRITTVVGGMSITRQSNQVRRGTEVLVATPGRLDDLIQRGDVFLEDVAITVLDEADQMADMGFLPQVVKLLEQVADGGQRMLFSATLDRNVDRLVNRFLTDPVTHSVDPSAGAVTTMDHHLLQLEPADKAETTARIAARDGRVIMFVHTKHGADRLAKQLRAHGVVAAALHGGKSQPQRNRVLDQFREGEVTALIATNVAARGIHIDGLDLVVNVDPPIDHKDYLHRGGRTARAGESGTVVTLVLPEQRREVNRLMSIAGIRPTVTKVRPEDGELGRITGARTPSGVAVTLPVPATAQPAAPAATREQNAGGTENGSGGGRGRGRGRGGAKPVDGEARRRPAKRADAGLPKDVDMSGNPRRPRPKQRPGAGNTQMAAGFIGKASGRAKPGSGAKSGSNYGTGRQRRKAD
ncbi:MULTISPECIES: DEAD/DEAH box helicase [Kitasatospora]|uniref:Putative ATP-dependent RNA helicase n=1 Tax=Kitasatospora setae (strain ATCC 33774 / DSM 43861 / JCM 3304 / KCC A-0304 / NBRC 14216 / KM-6054) TaxID=452652 RepID=E4N9E0_KITSK|nr:MULTISPECIES: DEAD/DEAH box helicase [Kitasatospora]BAJ27821.1 putative ATP-dependent RNA helicase [Kitasatospora setae KM-6054]